MSGTCAICNRPGFNCSHCHKVSYCGVEHQHAHRLVHKNECFPAVVKEDKSRGKFLVATRTIEQGMTFLRETSMIYGPSGLPNGTDGFMKICLGCYKPVISDYLCATCRWPVCNQECEKRAPHVKFECSVFATNQVPPITRRIDYEFVNIIRCLLLRDSNPNRWQKLMEMDSYVEDRISGTGKRKKTKRTSEGLLVVPAEAVSPARVDEVVRFVRTTCKMTQFDVTTIDYIHGVVGVNSFGENAVPSADSGIYDNRWGSFIFEKSGMLSHNCVPNTRWFIHEKWTSDLRPTYTIYWKATLEIKRGEIVSTSYTDLTKGSYERKLDLYEGYYFTCTCGRCTDPKELGTFFSGIKCTGCSDGYVVPYPLSRCKAAWRCSELCGGTMTEVEVKRLIDQLQGEYARMDRRHPQGIVYKLNEFLLRNQKHVVHRNHYVMMEAEMDLTQRLLTVIPTMTDNGVRTLWIKRVVELTQHAVDVFAILVPGKSLNRGYYLFYIAQAKYYMIMNEFGMGNSCNQTTAYMREAIEGLNDEAREIMNEEPEGSEARILAQSSTLHEKLQVAKHMIEERLRRQGMFPGIHY